MRKGLIFTLISALILLVTTLVYLSNVYAEETGKIDGIRLYKNNCAICHSDNGIDPELGQELSVPDLADPAWQASRSDEILLRQINEGMPKKTPSFKDKLEQGEIKGFLPIVRGFGALH